MHSRVYDISSLAKGHQPVQRAEKILAVTSADVHFVPMLRDMVASFQSFPQSQGIDFACFDLGLGEAGRAVVAGIAGARILAPTDPFGLIPPERMRPHDVGFAVRPFLPDYFPGYDIYLWIDSDVWLQSFAAIEAYLDGARQYGMAIAHESEPGYRFQRWLFQWTAKHFLLGYGPITGTRLLFKRHFNAGIFAIRGDAPHWQAWADYYRRAIRRTGKMTPHDQFALNQMLHDSGLPVAALPANANWICDRGVPMWNDATGAFCEPLPPYRTISILHLAGPAKRSRYEIRRTGGGSFNAMIRYGTQPSMPPMQDGTASVDAGLGLTVARPLP